MHWPEREIAPQNRPAHWNVYDNARSYYHNVAIQRRHWWRRILLNAVDTDKDQTFSTLSRRNNVLSFTSGTAAKHCLRRLEPKDRRFGEQITHCAVVVFLVVHRKSLWRYWRGDRGGLGAHITKRIKWTTFRLSEEARRQLSSTIGLWQIA